MVNNNNNIPSIFSLQVESGEGGVYADLTSTFVAREVVSELFIEIVKLEVV